MPTIDPERQLAAFITKFTPKMAKMIRGVRAKMRTLIPQASELVYDNYNFFVIGYGPNEKAGDAIFSLVAQAKGINLCFLQGAKLPDPHKQLRGSGNVVRNIRLEPANALDDQKIRQLMDTALKRAKSPIPVDGSHQLIIKSVSAKQRPRRSLIAKKK
jgi:hypothetical protein